MAYDRYYSPAHDNDATTPASAAWANHTEDAIYELKTRWLNVKDYGAVGDGVTDDTVAIQAAMDAAANSVLYFPPGTYLVSTVNITVSGVRIHGHQATLRHKAGSQNPILYRAQGLAALTDLTIFGMRFVGNLAESRTTVSGGQTFGSGGTLTVASTTGFAATGQFAIGVTPYSYTGKTGNTFTGVTPGATVTNGQVVSQEGIKSGVFVTNVNDVRITDCIFEDFMSAAIGLGGCRRFWIERNKVIRCTSDGGRNAIHVDIDYTDAANTAKATEGFITDNYVQAPSTGGTAGIVPTIQTTTSNHRTRIVIARNIVRDFTNWTGISVEGGYVRNTIVSENEIYNCKLGIAMNSGGTFGGLESSSYNIVADNLIDCESCAAAGGINLVGNANKCDNNLMRVSGTGIFASTGVATFDENVTITNNTVVIANTDTAARPVGIAMSALRQLIVKGNIVTRETDATLSGMGHGMTINSCRYVIVAENIIHKAGGDIMQVDNASSYVSVINNTAIDSNSQNIVGRGLYVNAADRTRIIGNQIIDTGTATPAAAGIWLHSSSTLTIVQNNDLVGLNTSVDAAATLGIYRDNRTSSRATPNGGSSVSTPGAVTTLTISHGCTKTPTQFSVQAGDANARGAPSFYVTADGSNLTLNFSSPLAAATPYTWVWTARV